MFKTKTEEELTLMEQNIEILQEEEMKWTYDHTWVSKKIFAGKPQEITVRHHEINIIDQFEKDMTKAMS